MIYFWCSLVLNYTKTDDVFFAFGISKNRKFLEEEIVIYWKFVFIQTEYSVFEVL